MSEGIRRRDFLRGLFHGAGGASAEAAQGEAFSKEEKPGYLSMLPPEFSPSMLRMEAERLGGDVEHMSEEDMAALVAGAMYGSGFKPFSG